MSNGRAIPSRSTSRAPALAAKVALPLLVVLLASWQVTLRSEDPTGVARVITDNLFNRSAGDLAQYRPLSHIVVVGIREVLRPAGSLEPYLYMRFAQCVLIFALAYAYYGKLGLSRPARLLGIGIVAGIMSLSLGALGPSTFSLDRFTDTVFFLVAALLVLQGLELWIPLLMVFAMANRETSMFIPLLIVARHGLAIVRDRALRRPLFAALAAWAIGTVVYVGIHAYYGPQPRTEHSYFGPDMFLNSLRMRGQTVYLFAAVNLLPVIAWLSLDTADAFLRRLFWLVVPVWFALHIWAARLGEGMLYLTPITLILVPLALMGAERRTRPAATVHAPT